MIDFTLTETDQAVLDHARAGALLCRKHARYYDENEHEMAPEVLPEAEAFFANTPRPPAAGPEDTSPPVMMALHTMIQHWGDYTIRLKRSGGGLVGFEARESLAELGEGDLPLPVPDFMHRALAARQSLVGAGVLGGDLVFESLDAFEG